MKEGDNGIVWSGPIGNLFVSNFITCLFPQH
jgi:hypothetical protein